MDVVNYHASGEVHTQNERVVPIRPPLLCIHLDDPIGRVGSFSVGDEGNTRGFPEIGTEVSVSLVIEKSNTAMIIWPYGGW